MLELEMDTWELVRAYRAARDGADAQAARAAAVALGLALASIERARRAGEFGSGALWRLACQDVVEARRRVKALRRDAEDDG